MGLTLAALRLSALRSASRHFAAPRAASQRNVPFNHLEYDRCT